MEPRIQYAKTSDGVSIAVATLGEGPPLVMVLPHFLSHVQLEWEIWPYFFQPLARKFRVVRYNPRGSGLSDREASDFSMDAMMRDIEAAIARVGLDTFALTGHGVSAPIAVTYAAARPDRVSRLILVDVVQSSDLTQSPTWQADRVLRNEDWVFYTDTFVRVLWGIDDPGFAHRMAEFMRACVEPEALRALFAAMEEWDISALLPRIKAPTLVVQNRENRYAPAQNTSWLAAQIPNARFVVVDDIVHEGLAGLIEDFVGPPATPELPSGTAIILFADIADSTALTERLGDAAFREKARELDEALRRAITSTGGTAIEGKLLGDGVLAVFTSAREAIEAALACGKAGESCGLGLHLGIHAGDVIREEGNVYGGAVNVASRIADASAPGEVLVSGTVRDLARTSAGVSFEERGERELKGVSEPVRVWAVRAQRTE
ncbi:MAG: hypothetical protein A2148_07270 [Chloroflexi bacterium RBG_16_68_14]|nr:MAG: hypothetical protein A2148_07270 [Chloroflexi bacterium RBG_16_68_14]